MQGYYKVEKDIAKNIIMGKNIIKGKNIIIGKKNHNRQGGREGVCIASICDWPLLPIIFKFLNSRSFFLLQILPPYSEIYAPVQTIC